ncbi:MAG: hypothetical protein IPO63_12285 [Bacteroidetes bacterium]|nr:hypothetical protein [Bacteroidota bacterium]
MSKYPIYEVKRLIRKLGKVAVVAMHLHPGKRIIRARPNYNGEKFSKVSELSYKPGRYNLKFQRASSPRMTMFYGSLIPDFYRPNEILNARVIGCFESIPLIRENQNSGVQVISFGKWIVTKKISLCAIVFHKNFLLKNSFANELNSGYEEFVKRYPDFEKDSLMVSSYFANYFANNKIADDYDYIMSACFTEMAVEKGFAGVLYPSVRGEGHGFNVAIHPYFVDSAMELEAVGQSTIYKLGTELFLDNDLVALVLKGQMEFNLKPVLPNFHLGRENVIKELILRNFQKFEN